MLVCCGCRRGTLTLTLSQRERESEGSEDRRAGPRLRGADLNWEADFDQFDGGGSKTAPASMPWAVAQSWAGWRSRPTARVLTLRDWPSPQTMVMPLESIAATSPAAPPVWSERVEPSRVTRSPPTTLQAPGARSEPRMKLWTVWASWDQSMRAMSPSHGTLVGHVVFVLDVSRGLIGLDELDCFGHGLDAEREEVLAVDLVEGGVGADGAGALQQDWDRCRCLRRPRRW